MTNVPPIEDPPSEQDPRPRRRCRKARHVTIDSARKERERMEQVSRSKGDKRPVVIYPCGPCTQSLGRTVWHIGHEKGAQP
jgi:hypothetical protein